MSENAVAEQARTLTRNFNLAVDVGANDGGWSSYLSGFFKAVIAIEPDERCSCRLPQIASVNLIKAMAGPETGTADFHLRSQSKMNSVYVPHPVATPSGEEDIVVASISCDMVTLDSVCDDGADFVKVDTEGFEHEVLRGCRDVHRWSRTVFVVECHANGREVLEELKRLGKTVVSRIENSEGTHAENFWILAQ